MMTSDQRPTAPTVTLVASRAALLMTITVMSLAGCADAVRSVGYDKPPPDEFSLVARAPLSQPPDATVRPPNGNALRPQEAPQVKASRAAPAAAPAATSDLSAGEQLLFAKVGTPVTDIRRKVNEDATALVEADKAFSDKILLWQDSPGAAAAKPSAAKSPTITREKTGWLGGIF